MENSEIAKKIIELKNADLRVRDELVKSGQLGAGYNKEMAELHDRNAEVLEEVIDTIGYPTVDKVGEEANNAAWLVIQHAIGRPSFMRRCEQLLSKAVEEHKENPIHLAYLSDRIAVFEGRPQRYGTSFDWDENGELNPKQVDDITLVDRRRRSLGLNTLQEQTELMRAQAFDEGQSAPLDLEAGIREFESWKKAVGWSKNEL